jgi:hypothetical protein
MDRARRSGIARRWHRRVAALLQAPLPEVLDYHRDSLKILHTLKPIGVAMAGEDEYDPFKD